LLRNAYEIHVDVRLSKDSVSIDVFSWCSQ